MNIGPPPVTGNAELDRWLSELYEFLKFPAFHGIRFVPRTSTNMPTDEGSVYYDSSDDKLKARDASAWNDTY